MTKAANIKWTRSSGNGNGGLRSVDGRFEIYKVVTYILGTKCVSFSLYDGRTRILANARQGECKAHAAAITIGA